MKVSEQLVSTIKSELCETEVDLMSKEQSSVERHSELVSHPSDEQPVNKTPVEEVYDCCICRLESISTAERPIGAVTLLQSTSGQSFLSLTEFIICLLQYASEIEENRF